MLVLGQVCHVLTLAVNWYVTITVCACGDVQVGGFTCELFANHEFGRKKLNLSFFVIEPVVLVRAALLMYPIIGC